MANQNRLRLRWQRFREWFDVCDPDDERYQFPCIYVVADRRRVPLYIGSTRRDGRGNSRWLGGLKGRYYSDWGALDASMDGSGNSIFIAEVEASQARGVERQLIYEEKPKYNVSLKRNPPNRTWVLQHEGDMPHFTNQHS